MLKSILKKILFCPPITRRLVKWSLILHNNSYHLCSMLSTALEPGGIHPKHRLMKYHDWFLRHIDREWTVLDVGCGNGALTYDLAGKAKRVIGIDINSNNINRARQDFKRENITYIAGDATTFDFKEKVDIIVLSNVLEHIQNRVDFLKKLSKLSDKFLIRVPMFNRDWITLYKKELGVEWRLDKTHYVEYTLESFTKELKEAGLSIIKYDVKFGEIYSICKVRENNE